MNIYEVSTRINNKVNKVGLFSSLKKAKAEIKNIHFANVNGRIGIAKIDTEVSDIYEIIDDAENTNDKYWAYHWTIKYRGGNADTFAYIEKIHVH